MPSLHLNDIVDKNSSGHINQLRAVTEENVMKYTNLSSKGFSLVELMIVVVIIGILAAVAVPAYFNHILRSRQADAYHNLLDIKAAQEMYYSQNDAYYINTGSDLSNIDVDNPFIKLLSFNSGDSKYYRYRISSGDTFTFTAVAEGKFKKLSGDSIRITDDADPCISSHGELKMSLGLENCPP